MFFSLSHHFPWIGNLTWSIKTFLKTISPRPYRATLGAAGHCTSVTALWQSARCDCSICTGRVNSSILLCVRIPKVEQEVQHRVCTRLACWLELNALFENQDTQGRKWNKFLTFSCIANRTKWGLSVEFCLGCSEFKWFISRGTVAELLWCLRPGRNIKCVTYLILTFNHSFNSFAKYLLDTQYVLPVKQRLWQIPCPHGAYMLVEIDKYST